MKNHWWSTTVSVGGLSVTDDQWIYEPLLTINQSLSIKTIDGPLKESMLPLINPSITSYIHQLTINSSTISHQLLTPLLTISIHHQLLQKILLLTTTNDCLLLLTIFTRKSSVGLFSHLMVINNQLIITPSKTISWYRWGYSWYTITPNWSIITNDR